MSKGGPPRHVHHDQDEWFYVVQGHFVIEVGPDRFHLHPGDSFFAPRQIPHAHANVGDTPGTLLTAVSPAGTFETFLHDTTRLPSLPTPEEIAAAFAAHNMTVTAPPPHRLTPTLPVHPQPKTRPPPSTPGQSAAPPRILLPN